MDITFEVIDRFLERRAVQLDRDHKATAAEMTRNLGALVTTGATR
jgi:hypothetical protein